MGIKDALVLARSCFSLLFFNPFECVRVCGRPMYISLFWNDLRLVRVTVKLLPFGRFSRECDPPAYALWFLQMDGVVLVCFSLSFLPRFGVGEHARAVPNI